MYEVNRTNTFNYQLNEIIQYIAQDTQDIDTAINYLSVIEESINKLQTFPYIGISPRYPILRNQGYRVLVIQKHLVFYKVYEAKDKASNLSGIVTLFSIVDSRREYELII